MRIGILTGGGDCSGLNACIRGIVLRALDFQHQLIGIKDGWKGLLRYDYEPLYLTSVDEIINTGGTILGTSRTNPFKKEGDWDKLKDNFKKMNLQALIAIGGDDTLSVANKLSKDGFVVIGVPKTMDNDIAFTDFTFGFDSAVSVAVDALERLRDTAKSHRRIVVFEVMGRETGWVALYTALAGGADWVIIPEVETNLDEMCDYLKELRIKGKQYSLVVVSEGVEIIGLETNIVEYDEFGHPLLREKGVGEYITKIIEEKTDIQTRFAAIGHIQRGGPPSVFDRILASRFGVKAVELLQEGKTGKMVCLQGNDIGEVDLEIVVEKPKFVPKDLYEQAKILLCKKGKI